MNPKYITWTRQDKLIFRALLGAISTPLETLVAAATTSLEAWKILGKTYGTPTRGHLKQLRDQLKKASKGTKSIDDYMQLMKSKADQLALLGKPTDHEDLIEFILDGLPEEYRAVKDLISFEELHEKLLNREADIVCNSSVSEPFPVTANVAGSKQRNNWKPQNRHHHDQQQNMENRNTTQRYSRPYLGKCQACGVQGHSAQRCPRYKLTQNSEAQTWHPRANVANYSTPTAEIPSWFTPYHL